MINEFVKTLHADVKEDLRHDERARMLEKFAKGDGDYIAALFAGMKGLNTKERASTFCVCG